MRQRNFRRERDDQESNNSQPSGRDRANRRDHRGYSNSNIDEPEYDNYRGIEGQPSYRRYEYAGVNLGSGRGSAVWNDYDPGRDYEGRYSADYDEYEDDFENRYEDRYADDYPYDDYDRRSNPNEDRRYRHSRNQRSDMYEIYDEYRNRDISDIGYNREGYRSRNRNSPRRRTNRGGHMYPY